MTETVEYSIKLVVEDGRGVPLANSYVSSEYADTYARNRNYDGWLSQSDYVKQAAIIKAMDYIDNLFEWKGRRKYPEQELKFPRVELWDTDGFDLSGKIPECLKKAVCEAAFYVYEQYTLFISQDPVGAIKKDRKKADVAEIEKEYFSSKEQKVDYTSIYQSLDSLLRGLYYTKDSRVNVPVHWEY